MTSLAYHASHEQFAPSRLLKLVIAAEDAGFEAIHSSDHFHPWSTRQGQSGFSFSWIAAALQATSLPFSMVCAPGQRYHPAIVAQGIATIGEMFPGRFSVELGSGEAINEMITGEPWPGKSERNQRLLECAHIIRDLLHGKQVSFEGLVKVNNAKLYSLPPIIPPLFCAALSEATASWAGEWADGLITTASSLDEAKSKVEAFRRKAPGKPVYLQCSFSYHTSKEEALEGAYQQWRSSVLKPEQLSDIGSTEEFDRLVKDVSKDEYASKVQLFNSMPSLIEHIRQFLALDIQRISLHNLNTDHELFISDFKRYVGESGLKRGEFFGNTAAAL